MPKSRKKAVAAGEIDPTSDDVVLAYVDEDDRSARNVPARDLTHADIARLAYQRSLSEVYEDVGKPIDPDEPDGPRHQRPDPREPDQAAAAAIIEELVATGIYSTDLPPAPADPTPVTEPATPATKPEA